MNQEYLNTITQTINGYPVKNLRWLPVDNIITGLVQDPVTGNAKLHDGFVSGQWTRKGYPTNRIKGREELRIEIDLIKAI